MGQLNRNIFSPAIISRRTLFKVAGAGVASSLIPPALADMAPIKIGLQAHLTGIGASYGHWYQKVSESAVKSINDAGGDRKSTRLNSSHQ